MHREEQLQETQRCNIVLCTVKWERTSEAIWRHKWVWCLILSKSYVEYMPKKCTAVDITLGRDGAMRSSGSGSYCYEVFDKNLAPGWLYKCAFHTRQLLHHMYLECSLIWRLHRIRSEVSLYAAFDNTAFCDATPYSLAQWFQNIPRNCGVSQAHLLYN